MNRTLSTACRAALKSTRSVGLAVVLGAQILSAQDGTEAFRRGDANLDGTVDALDGEHVLRYLELGLADLACQDAADANDDGTLDFEDAMALLRYAEAGEPVPPAPGPRECGPDPTRDRLPSAGYPPHLCPDPSVPPRVDGPVLDVTIEPMGDGSFAVAWTNPEGAPADRPTAVFLNDDPAGEVDGGATSWILPPLAPEHLAAIETLKVCVVNASGYPACAGFPAPPPAFLRGDSNGTGDVDISDAIFTLARLFVAGEPFPCSDSADANDDGSVDISDPVLTLGFQFLGGAPPSEPYPGCGRDASDDALFCDVAAGCAKEKDPCPCESHTLRSVYVNSKGSALPVGTMHIYTWLTCGGKDPSNQCEGTVTVGKSPFSVSQSTQVPCDGKRHTGEFKNFKVSTEIGTKLEIPISVECGGASSSTTITIVWKAFGELDDAQSDIDGDGVVNKDDKNAGDPTVK